MLMHFNSIYFLNWIQIKKLCKNKIMFIKMMTFYERICYRKLMIIPKILRIIQD